MIIRCVREEPHEDGSMTIELEYDAEFKAWFKSFYGLKRLSAVRLRKWVLKAIEAGLDKAGV